MSTVYTAEDIAKHNTKSDLWISIHGNVYDLTPYLEDHPGGVDSLVEIAGQDGTQLFEELGHTDHARELMARFLVGKLDQNSTTSSHKVARVLPPITPERKQRFFRPDTVSVMLSITALSFVVVASCILLARHHDFVYSYHLPIPSALSRMVKWIVSISFLSQLVKFELHRLTPSSTAPPPKHFKVTACVASPSSPVQPTNGARQYTDLPIISVEQLSHNANKIIVALPTPTSTFSLPVGQHVSVRALVDGKMISRSYTPISSNKDLGRIELVVKNYDTGLFTGKYLKNVKAGDKLSISGPRGQMHYRRGLAKKIFMIAGGSGITPMFQMIQAICEDVRDETEIVLLYTNRYEEDILLRIELEELGRKHSRQLQVQYLLSQPTSHWTGGVGRITQEMIQDSFGLGNDRHNKVMLCGPAGLVDDAKDWLARLGYDKPNAVSRMADQVFVF